MARLSKSVDVTGFSPAHDSERNRQPVEAPESPSAGQRLHVEYWPLERLKPYERNPRRNDKAVDQIRASIRECVLSGRPNGLREGLTNTKVSCP